MVGYGGLVEKQSRTFVPMRGIRGWNPRKPMEKYYYTPHIRPRDEEKKAIKERYKARRLVVEVAHSWFNRFRKPLVRFKTTISSYLAFLQLAAKTPRGVLKSYTLVSKFAHILFS